MLSAVAAGGADLLEDEATTVQQAKGRGRKGRSLGTETTGTPGAAASAMTQRTRSGVCCAASLGA